MSQQDDLPVQPTPPLAAEIFGPALGTAERYVTLLAGAAVQRGLLGPGEAARVWDRHVLNCAVVAELVPSPSTLIDLGSGPGLPGIVFAMLLPEVSVTLLEPMARRVTFLEECVAELGLANTTVMRGRAEDLAGQLAADVVVARAVAPMDKLAGLALGLVKPGGLVLAIKGASAGDEVSRAKPELRKLGARDVEVLKAGDGKVEPAATVVRFTAGQSRGRSGRSTGGAQRSAGPDRVRQGVSVARRTPSSRGRRGTG